MYNGAYETAGFGTKLRRMNYDIHIGSILGFPGKVMAFLASLIGASLPITGFLVWYGRKFKKKGFDKRTSVSADANEQENVLKQEELLTE